MNQNEQLRTFLLSNAKRLTEEWYDSLDKKMLPEFMRVRKQYRDSIEEFVNTYEGSIEPKLINAWEEHVIRIFDITILKFITAAEETSSLQLKAQQEMIHELSSPVITIKKDIALLPH